MIPLLKCRSAPIGDSFTSIVLDMGNGIQTRHLDTPHYTRPPRHTLFPVISLYYSLVRYFTVKLIKGQLLRVGWLTHGFSPSEPIGGDDYSWAVDGFRAHKWHNGKPEKFGRKWKIGDTIICLLDLDRRTMCK